MRDIALCLQITSALLSLGYKEFPINMAYLQLVLLTVSEEDVCGFVREGRVLEVIQQVLDGLCEKYLVSSGETRLKLFIIKSSSI